MNFIFYLSSGSSQLGHHRIVTYGKQKYSFVPHSHAILHPFCAFGLFVLLSPPHAFSFWIFHSGSSIHSVLLLERCIQLSAHGWRGTFGNLVLIWFSILLWYIMLFPGDFDSYCPFGFEFMARNYLNIIYCLSCFLSMGLLLSPPKTF